MSDNEPPSLYEIKELTRDWGLVGEESTVMVIFLSFFGGGMVIMSGLSSGGKDACVNAAEFCVPDDGFVYQIPTSLSKTALYEKADTINGHPVHRHKDISSLKDKDFLEDIWKRHGQGSPISHSWTEVVPERHEVSKTLESPHSMILFLASDNDNVDLNDYAEIRNRALVVGIDDSADLTEKVNTRQAKQEAGIIERRVTPERATEIRDYVGSIPMHMFSDTGSGGFLNPVSPALDNQNPLPQLFTEARRDFPRLMDFMNSVALFHHGSRMKVPQKQLDEMNIDNTMTLMVTPADAWLAMRIFGEKMILSSLNLRDKDFALLEVLRANQGEQYGVDILRQKLRQKGWNITDTDVRSSLKNMHSKGYVRVDKNQTPHQWSASEFATQQSVSRKVELDWPTIVDDTRELVTEHYPEEVAEEYIANHLEGSGLLVTHPFSGHTVNLTEETANELEEKVEEQEVKEATALDGTSDDDSDDDDDWGTLT